VHLNSADLSGFQVADSEVQQRYRYKNLKAAMCHIPDGKELGGPVSTKVGLFTEEKQTRIMLKHTRAKHHCLGIDSSLFLMCHN
jgi:hypothetical protein